MRGRGGNLGVDPLLGLSCGRRFLFCSLPAIQIFAGGQGRHCRESALSAGSDAEQRGGRTRRKRLRGERHRPKPTANPIRTRTATGDDAGQQIKTPAERFASAGVFLFCRTLGATSFYYIICRARASIKSRRLPPCRQTGFEVKNFRLKRAETPRAGKQLCRTSPHVR